LVNPAESNRTRTRPDTANRSDRANDNTTPRTPAACATDASATTTRTDDGPTGPAGNRCPGTNASDPDASDESAALNATGNPPTETAAPDTGTSPAPPGGNARRSRKPAVPSGIAGTPAALGVTGDTATDRDPAAGSTGGPPTGTANTGTPCNNDTATPNTTPAATARR
jgi:hypothetical protein